MMQHPFTAGCSLCRSSLLDPGAVPHVKVTKRARVQSGVSLIADRLAVNPDFVKADHNFSRMG